MLKKIITALVIATLALASENSFAQPYTVSVQPLIVPPISPFVAQLLSPAGGGYVSAIIRNISATPGGSMRIKLLGSIQRLSPSPFTISLSTNYYPKQPIILTGNAPVSLTGAFLEEVFGNFDINNLVFDGITPDALKTGLGTNYKLPEGVYRICFSAYDFDVPGYATPISAPGTGCSTFTVCYQASAPQFIQPVNAVSLTSTVSIVNPTYPFIFSWTQPSLTCGGAINPLTYDLEIHTIYDGQTPTDALNNPPLFIKQGLPTPIFPFDTLLYQNILSLGNKYVVRVHATTGNAVNNAVTFANNGYSAPEIFQYGVPPPKIDMITVHNDNPTTPEILPITKGISVLPGGTTGGGTTATGTGGNCGVAPPTGTPVTQLSNGAALTVAGFKLTATTIKANGDGTFSGSGTVTWTPASSPIQLNVTFSSINVNTQNQVYGGTVVASLSTQAALPGTDFSQFSTFAQQSGTQLDQLSSTVANYVKNNPATTSISKLTGATPVSLPLGLDNLTMGGTPVTFNIMSVVFAPKGATMTVLYNMQVPEANSSLTLVGANFCINPTGGFSAETGNLVLPADKLLNLGSGTNGLNITFKGSPGGDTTNGTYISWKSGSIQKILAHATMQLPRSTVVPENNNYGQIAGDTMVTAQLIFSLSNWDDWVASVNLPHFEVPQLSGFSFQPTGIYYDHSTQQNAPSFKVPSNYPGGNPGNSFEGLFIDKLAIYLPPTFTTFNNSGTRTSFQAADVIVDGDGLTAAIKGLNVIDITKGSLGGWSFSLDTVKIDIVQNTFQSGSFAGGILLPVSKTPLHYDADMQVGNNGSSPQYSFVAHPQSNMNFDLWAATVTLDQNSSISIGTDAIGTAISATLNGKASLNTGSISFPGLSFNGLGFSNRKNGSNSFSLNEGTWSFASPQKYIGTADEKGGQDDEKDYDNSGDASGFPVSINNIAPYFNQTTTGSTENINLGVSFDLNVTLGDASVISGTTHLDIYGSLKASVSNSFAPSINLGGPTVKFDTINVNGDVGPVSVDGTLIFYKNDSTFGNGFKGSVSADFSIVSGQATAQFGSVHGYSYWFVDASLNLPPPGILLGSSSLSIVGFGGGAYYNMSINKATLPQPDKIPQNPNNNNQTPGSSSSGAAYIPSKGTAGMLAAITLADVNPDIINATVQLGAQITNGALSDIDIKGSAYAITDYPSNSSAVVTGILDMNWDIADGSFTVDVSLKGNFVVATVNVPFHFYAGHDGFYFKLGDPDKMNSAVAANAEISVQLAQVNTAIFSENIGFKAYFAFGAGSAFQPNFPALPDYIIQAGLKPSQTATSIISALNSSTKDAAMLLGARGNASLSFDLAIFYASGAFDIGFDLEIAKYANAQCNNSSMGWDGWYALGQIYANMSFDIGINVDVWFFDGKIDLCNFGAAALLQGGLPNPVWVSGAAEAHGSVLDGLISFNTSFHFTVGNPCYPTPHDPLQDIQIISDFGPTDSSSIYDKPYLASNEGLNKNFSVPIPPTAQYPNGSTRTYRFILDSYKLTYKDKNGNSVDQPGSVSLEYENSDKSVNIYHEETLEPNTTYTVIVVAKAQQLEGGTWTDPYVDSVGKNMPMIQPKTFNFKTGPAPAVIPDNIVHFAYPVNKERYVLKKEFGGAGTLQFNQWPDYLFSGTVIPSGSKLEYLVYFIDVATNDTLQTTFTPLNIGNGGGVNFNLPSGLKNNTIYREEFWKLIVAPPQPTLTNTLSVSTRTLDLNYGGSTNITGVGGLLTPVTGLQSNIALTPETNTSASVPKTTQMVTKLPANNLPQTNNTLPTANLTNTSSSSTEASVRVTSRDGSAANAPSSINSGLQTNAQNFTNVQEKQSNLLSGGKVAAPKPKPIYVVYFGTSGYNTFADKMKGLSTANWVSVQNNGSATIGGIQGTAPATITNGAGNDASWEDFDTYEENGFTTPDGTKMAPFFTVDVPWDNSNTDDIAITNMYKAAQTAVNASPDNTLKIEYYSSGITRDQYDRPQYTVTQNWGNTYGNTTNDPHYTSYFAVPGPLSSGECANGGITNVNIGNATSYNSIMTAEEGYAVSPTAKNSFNSPLGAGAITLTWNAPTIVNNDFSLLMDLSDGLSYNKNSISNCVNKDLQNMKNYGIVTPANSLTGSTYNAGTYNPDNPFDNAWPTSGSIVAPNLYKFATDPSYYTHSLEYTGALKTLLNYTTNINHYNCLSFYTVNSTHPINFLYTNKPYNTTIVYTSKFVIQAAPAQTSPSSNTGNGGGTSTGGTKIKAND